MTDCDLLDEKQSLFTEEELKREMELLKAQREEAMKLILQAREASSEKKAIQLLKKATEVSCLSYEAYVELGILSKQPEQSIKYFETAIEIMEDIIGPENLALRGKEYDAIGSISEAYIVVSRLLLREYYKEGWIVPAVEVAIKLLEHKYEGFDMELDRLALCYFEEGEDSALLELLDRFEKTPTVCTQYTKALLHFKMGGNNVEASCALEDAIRLNPYVAAFFLGKTQVLAKVTDKDAFAHFLDEANPYIYLGSDDHWEGEEGALDWLTLSFSKYLQKLPSWDMGL